MTLKTDIEKLIKIYESRKEDLRVNKSLLDIGAGNILQYLDGALKKSLNPKSYKNAVDRLCPINPFKKIIDKVACIYAIAPARFIEDGTEQDKSALAELVKDLDANAIFDDGTDVFETSRSCLMQPFVHEKKIRMRVIPNDRFFVYSDNHIDPTEPTHIVLFDVLGPEKITFYAYTKDEFLIFDQDKKVRTDLMALYNADGKNPYGALPFVYANSSRLSLVPEADRDSLQMSVLLPLLLTDLNFAHKFQCFAMIYGINLDDKNISRSPDVFLSFKTDQNADGSKAEIGSIKPDVDIESSIALIQTEMAMWMDTRGIRAAGVGQAGPSNFVSAVSKMVDEADNTEARLSLAEYFGDVEAKFWKLLMHKMLPVWIDSGELETNVSFTADCEVRVSYTIIEPVKPRSVMVADLKAELEAGFVSYRMAMQKLYPDLEENELDKLIAEIDGDKQKAIANAQAAMGNKPGEEKPEEESEGTENPFEKTDDAGAA